MGLNPRSAGSVLSSRLFLAASVLLAAGCSTHYHVPEPDDLGWATRCLWKDLTPNYCQYDPTRYTIDREALQELIDELERYKLDQKQRRHLTYTKGVL